MISTRGGAAVHQLTGTPSPASVGVQIAHQALTGGSNQFPQGIDPSIPYFKTGYSALMVNGIYNTQGHGGVVLALAAPFRWLAPVLDDASQFFRAH